MTSLIAVAIVAYLVGYLMGRRRPPANVVWQSAALPSAADSPEVVELIERGATIEAVKRYRELYGTGLEDSRDAVEALERQLEGG